jgi:hypothetical protein
MTILGWVFMLASNAFVWGLTGWCFNRVLNLPPEEREPPEPVREFHSA